MRLGCREGTPPGNPPAWGSPRTRTSQDEHRTARGRPGGRSSRPLLKMRVRAFTPPTLAPASCTQGPTWLWQVSRWRRRHHGGALAQDVPLHFAQWLPLGPPWLWLHPPCVHVSEAPRTAGMRWPGPEVSVWDPPPRHPQDKTRRVCQGLTDVHSMDMSSVWLQGLSRPQCWRRSGCWRWGHKGTVGRPRV